MTPRRAGFTLVELMIVVAIIGILAAIAIPNFRTMAMRAKRAEVPPNITAIQHAEFAYEAVFDSFKGITDPHPRIDERLDAQAVTWDKDAEVNRLGWQPDGDVRGNYQINVNTDHGEHMIITGKTDIDDDNQYAVYTATNETNVELVSDQDIL